MEEISFHLALGIEAIILIELRVPSTLVSNFDEQTNSERCLANLDLLDEVQKKACIRMVAYQYKVAHYFNAKVQGKTFKVDNLVLCQVEVSQLGQRGKLFPN